MADTGFLEDLRAAGPRWNLSHGNARACDRSGGAKVSHRLEPTLLGET